MSKPHVTYFPREGFWRVEDPYRYQENGVVINIPAGFCFDLASIPRILWRLCATYELSITAPLVHDYLYQHGGATQYVTLSRHKVDKLFDKIMEDEGVPVWRRLLAYRAVRLFGGWAWRGLE